MTIRTTTITRDRRRPPIPEGVARIDPYGLAALMGLAPPPVKLPVTERTVSGLPAAWAAVRKIANAVAQMMAGAKVFDGELEVTPRPLVVRRPNLNYGRFTFWAEVVTTALMHGNYVAVNADPDEDGMPQQVVPIPTEMINPTITREGRVDYEINGQHFTPDQLVHVKIGLTIPGVPWAMGVIEAHRRGLSGLLSQQGMANDVWDNGAVPSGVVQLDVDHPTEDQVKIVKSAWIGAVGGKRTVAVTGKRQSYTPITWSADDAQFIESRQFSVAEVAMMFGLDPSALDATVGGRGVLYANRADNALERITESYTPIMQPIEEAWSDLLLGDEVEVRGNVEALLRSSPKERLELHGLAQKIGLETVDETRIAEGKDPVPADELAELEQEADPEPDEQTEPTIEDQ